MHGDLDQQLRVVLESLKEQVRRHRDDWLCALVWMVLSDGQVVGSEPRFHGVDERAKAYVEVVAEAQRREAVMLITANSAFMRRAEPGESMQDVVADENNGKRCIMMSASGPGMDTVLLQLGYAIEGEAVRFDDEPTYYPRAAVHFLVGWPSENQVVKVQ